MKSKMGFRAYDQNLPRHLRLPLPLDSFGHHRCGFREQGAGHSGIRGRECSSQSLLGDWRSRDGEHDGEGHGIWLAHDSCRLEIVADGLPLFGGMQLAVDTTLVPHSTVTGPPDLVLHRLMERFSLSPDAKRNGRTLSS